MWRVMGERSAVRVALALLAIALIVAGLVPSAAGAATARRAYIDAPLLKLIGGPQGAVGGHASKPIPVIVHRSGARAAAHAVRRVGGQNERRLRTGHAIAAEVPANKIIVLAAQPGITRIQLDAPIRVLAKPEQVARGLQTVYPQAVRSAELWEGDRRLRGTGIGVAILDSGFDDHVDFGKRLERFGFKGSGGQGDNNGHGTYVAGIVGGSAGDGEYVGIAPDVTLIGVKVADRDGVSRISDVVAGIEWAIEHRREHNLRVLSLSLRSAMAEPYTIGLLNAAVEMAWLKGIVVVVSAGNGGPNTLFYPPANDPYVITVGATDDAGTPSVDDDRLATFSSYGTTQNGHPKPDLVAPGRRIVSTLSSPRDPLGRLYPDRITDKHYIRMSGTSASAPIVAGVVAQILQARPELTPDQVKWLLQRTARAIPGGGTGAGYPQAAAAVAYRGPVEPANRGLMPNRLVAMVGYAGLMGTDSVQWEAVQWEAVQWEAVQWEAVQWETVQWETVQWETVQWEAVQWEAAPNFPAGD
jgi:serine protease AprX